MLRSPGATPLLILKHFISMEIRETERGRWDRIISLNRKMEPTWKRLRLVGGGTPVCNKIPLGIVIFLVLLVT